MNAIHSLVRVVRKKDLLSSGWDVLEIVDIFEQIQEVPFPAVTARIRSIQHKLYVHEKKVGAFACRIPESHYRGLMK